MFIKRFFHIIFQNAFSENQKKQTFNVLLISEFVTLFGNLIYTIFAFLNHEDSLGRYYLIAFLPYIAATILTFFHKRVLANFILIFTYTWIFSMTFLGRIDNGIWALFLPVLAMYIMGYSYGLLFGALFLIANIFICNNPLLRTIMLQYYEPIYLSRYLVIYILSYIISAIVMFHYQLTRIKQNKNEKKLQAEVKKEHDKVSEIMMQTILSIGNAVEAKDLYTGQHSRRVAYFSCLIAEKLGWNQEQIHNMQIIAKLHDIGKIGISDNILNKPSKLTEDEFNILKQHTTIGYGILKDLDIVPNVELGAELHHERIDGTGYPKGLKGNNIPIEAKIICIADSFDAMKHGRIYQKKRDSNFIKEELKRGRGSQFDSELLDIFLVICEEHNWFMEEEELDG